MAIDLNDKTANGNTLTNNGATEITSSLPFATSSIAVDCEDNQYLEAADSASLSITNNLTLEGWFQIETLPNGGAVTLISKFLGTGNQRSFHFSYIDDGGVTKLRFFVSADGSTDGNVTVNWTATLNTWYHLAVTFASGSVKFYVDGSQQGTTQTSSETSIYNSTAVLRIGKNSDIVSNPVDIKADDIRIWSVVRSSTEINDNKSLELTGAEANLNAYWPFEVLGASESNYRGYSFII